MSMVFLGVPIFDWVLLVVVLGFGVEAWITCRPSKAEREEDARRKAAQAMDADVSGGHAPGRREESSRH